MKPFASTGTSVPTILRHTLFWSAYFLFALGSDLYLDHEGTVTLATELIFYLSQNVLLFYTLLYTVRRFSVRDAPTLVKSVTRFLLVTLAWSGLRHFLRYEVLAAHYNSYYGLILPSELFLMGLGWIIHYSFYACAYHYMSSTLRKQKERASMELAHAHSLQAGMQQETRQLELQNQMLRSQVNPHVLYNTLNLFYARSLPVCPDLADGILRLSEVMRYCLAACTARPMVSLEEEADHLRNMLGLARMEEPGEFYLSEDIPTCLPDVHVPPLVLTRVIEAALTHGDFSDRAHPGKVRLLVAKDVLRLEVNCLLRSAAASPVELLNIPPSAVVHGNVEDGVLTLMMTYSYAAAAESVSASITGDAPVPGMLAI